MVAIARGLEQKHEQDPRRLLRDTRTLSQRFVDFFKKSLMNFDKISTGPALKYYLPNKTRVIKIHS